MHTRHDKDMLDIQALKDKVDERKIEEAKKYETTLQVVETEDMTCEKCYFNYRKKCDIHCLKSERIDKKNVIFKEIKEL